MGGGDNYCDSALNYVELTDLPSMKWSDFMSFGIKEDRYAEEMAEA